jgi:type VI secretion system protein ImpE
VKGRKKAVATAEELYKAGSLRGAIEELIREVKARPTDTQRRTFLFELLCFSGDWERAGRQLDVLAGQSAEADVAAQVFRNCIKAEQARAELYRNGLAPHFLGEPPAYVDLHLDAISRIREGNYAEARDLLERAEEQRPAFSGEFNGAGFSDFRDYNDVTAPVLELIVHDKYTWLPLEQIVRLEIQPPKHLRDLLWPSALVESVKGPIGGVLVMMLYADSNTHDDDQVRLGRMTDWRQLDDGLYRGFGMKLFLVDDLDRPLVETREISFDHAAESEEGSEEEGPAEDPQRGAAEA